MNVAAPHQPPRAYLNGVPVSPRCATRIIDGATPTLIQRLETKMTATIPTDQCWGWTGTCAPKRDVARPKIRVGGRGSRKITVARVVLALYDGVSLWRRSRLEAGHTCGHYWCVNPLHLKWETRIQNEREKRRRERRARRALGVYPPIVDTSHTYPRVDPSEVANALGAVEGSR